MQLSKDTKRFLTLLCAFCIGLVLCVRHVTSITAWLGGVLSALMPFIVGACFAFVLSVPMHLFDRLLGREIKPGKPLLPPRARRPIALVLSILLVFLLIVLFAVIVLPKFAQTLSTLAGAVMRFVPTAQQWINELRVWLDRYPELRAIVEPYIPNVSQLASTAIDFVQRYALSAIATLATQVSSIFSSAKDIIIEIVFAVYVLLQKETLARQIRKLMVAFLPRWLSGSLLYVASLARNTFFSYIAIQCTEALILGALCLAGMLIFRFPYALVISVIMLFCALIPVYGAIISCVLGAFLVLIENPSQAIWFVLFILVLQQIENNLIYPRVVSTSINLPPMWVMLAVTVGGGLFGLIGMVTAVPVTSIVYTLLGEITRIRLESKHIDVDDLGNRSSKNT